jgi:glucose/arabinose dehydrogenase
MRRLALLCTVAGALATAATAQSAAEPAAGGSGRPAPEATLVPIGSPGHPIGDFDQPVDVTGAPGFRHLLFVVERPGVVRVVRRGKLLSRPFLDISGAVEDGFREQGLLSIAFPPDYRKTRRFYTFYTDLDDNLQIDEFRRRPGFPAQATRASRRPIMTIPHDEAPNHDGGQLLFHGNDLFFGTGDGGSGGDPPNNAQNLSVLLGKIIRIDPQPGPGGRPYTVPASNPFVGRPGRDEIYSYGLRNPYRFSIQTIPGAPDRIAIGDVGQHRFEEIDYATLPAANGANFGWDAWEGDELYNCGDPLCEADGTPDPGGTTKPILAYDHSLGCAVIGGYVVRNTKLASLLGDYLYSDNCAGDIRALTPALGDAADDRSLGLHVDSPSSFGETPAGRLYVASLGGPVFRIAPP